jgi:hypothetical protein
VIYVSQDQLKQVEYIIGQAVQGNHVLFEADSLRHVFTTKYKSEALSEEEAYSVEHHIEKLILLPSLPQKRAYLERLDAQTYKLVVRTYFSIVENNLFEKLQTRH